MAHSHRMRIEVECLTWNSPQIRGFPHTFCTEESLPASPINLVMTKYAIQYLARQNGYCKSERSLGFRHLNSTAQNPRLHDMWEWSEREMQLRALIRTRMVFQNGME